MIFNTDILYSCTHSLAEIDEKSSHNGGFKYDLIMISDSSLLLWNTLYIHCTVLWCTVETSACERYHRGTLSRNHIISNRASSSSVRSTRICAKTKIRTQSTYTRAACMSRRISSLCPLCPARRRRSTRTTIWTRRPKNAIHDYSGSEWRIFDGEFAECFSECFGEEYFTISWHGNRRRRSVSKLDGVLTFLFVPLIFLPFPHSSCLSPFPFSSPKTS